MDGIKLKQIDGSTVLPKDDAILYDMIVNQSGYIYGCDVTWVGGNQVHISAGYGIVKGRMFEIEDMTIYARLPKVSGKTYYGYMYIYVDLENTEEPIKIVTELTTTEWSIENGDFERDENINFINGMWSLVIANYTATSTAIESFETVWEKISGTYTSIKDFTEWSSVNKSGYLVDALLDKKRILTFNNIGIDVSSWSENDTYEDYPYIAEIPLAGVDSYYNVSVAFSLEDVISGIFAPVALTQSGKVCIYANSIPESKITIPTIQCIRKVG